MTSGASLSSNSHSSHVINNNTNSIMNNYTSYQRQSVMQDLKKLKSSPELALLVVEILHHIREFNMLKFVRVVCDDLIRQKCEPMFVLESGSCSGGISGVGGNSCSSGNGSDADSENGSSAVQDSLLMEEQANEPSKKVFYFLFCHYTSIEL